MYSKLIGIIVKLFSWLIIVVFIVKIVKFVNIVIFVRFVHFQSVLGHS